MRGGARRLVRAPERQGDWSPEEVAHVLNSRRAEFFGVLSRGRDGAGVPAVVRQEVVDEAIGLVVMARKPIHNEEHMEGAFWRAVRLLLAEHRSGRHSVRVDSRRRVDLEVVADKLAKLNRSLRAQTLRLEEHEDPNHPIVALASERIVELSTRKAALTDAIQCLKTERPAGHHPDEIVAMLDAVPDLRPTIATAADEELREIFRAFDVSILYDKDRQMLTLAATITPELVPDPAYENDRPEGRSQINEVAGAGFEPATFGL